MNTSTATLDKKTHRPFSLITASAALSIIYTTAAAPIPLYVSYSEQFELSHGDLAMTAAAYFIGTLIALLMFARLSNFCGRKPITFLTLILAITGCFYFYYATGIHTILIGRLVQGIACGLASSAIAAYIVDLAPARPQWLSAAITSGAPMLGLAIGAFGSGLINTYLSGSVNIIFGILIILLILCLILLLFCIETIERKKGTLRSIIPQINMPKSQRRYLPAACCIFIATWAVGGFYQAFSSSIATLLLDNNHTILAATIFACVMAPNLIGSMISGKFKPQQAQNVGMLLFLLSMITVVYALKIQHIALFLFACIAVGISWGIAFSGSMQILMSGISQQERAGVLSAIFLISYCGAVIPNLIIGQFASYWQLFDVAICYIYIVATACIITIIFSLFNQRLTN